MAAAAVVVHLPVRRVRPCDRFEEKFPGAKFCKHCTWREWLHPVFAACSSCGGEYEVKRKAEMGFSHCDQHVGRRAL